MSQSTNANYQGIEEGLGINSVPTTESSGMKKSVFVKVTSLLVVIATLCIAFTAGANSVAKPVSTDLAVDSLHSFDMALDGENYGLDGDIPDIADMDLDGM
jgi:hypothetical protein